MEALYTFRKARVKDGKRVTYNFVLRKPTREENEMRKVVYSSEKFKAVKAGMPTAAMITKHYSDQDTESILSKKEEAKYLATQSRIADLRSELVELSSRKIGQKKKKDEIKRIINEIQECQKILVDFEMIKSSIFNDTADAFAREKVIEYLLISFSMVQKSVVDIADEKDEDDFSELEYLFPGKNMEERYVAYDEFDKNEEFFNDVLGILIVVCTWYHQGSATTQEEFDELLALSLPEDSEDSKKPTDG